MNLTKGLPREAREDEPVALDLELFGADVNKLHRPTGEFACLSIAYRDMVYQFTDAHDVAEALKRVDKGMWIMTNASFDLRQLRRWAPVKQRRVWDTMIVEQELFGGYYTQFGLASQSLRWLETPMDKEERDEFTKAKEMDEQMSHYAALDSDVSLHVAAKQWAYIHREELPIQYYWKADEPCIWAILDMPPVRIDVANWSKLASTFIEQASIIKVKAETQFGINIASNDQVKAAIEKLTKRPIRDVQAGTLEDMLPAKTERLQKLIEMRLEYQHTAKLASTYGQKWLDENIESDCYVYSDWRITGASDTGRMASRHPNLQQIPRRRMPIFRSFFLSSPGNMFMASDVEQQEPRVLAYISKDKHLTEILLSGRSPHIVLGQDLFDKNFTKQDPRYLIAKSINLGLDYGLTPLGLSQRTGIDEDEAERYIQFYFKKYPGVKGYITTQRNFALRHDYVNTTLGRRCWVNPHSSKWQNNAINAPIQGTAAHMTKIALPFIHRESAVRGLPFCANLVVHDEMDCDTPREYVKKYEKLMRDAWSYAGEETIPGIPVVSEIEVGESWSCKEG